AAVEAALASEEKLLACISVKLDGNPEKDAKPEDVFEVGTLVMIKRMERVEDTLHLIVQGTDRIRVLAWEQAEPFLRARVQILPDLQLSDKEKVEATKRNVQSLIQQARSEEHTSELQSRENLVCRLLLEKKNKKHTNKHNKIT